MKNFIRNSAFGLFLSFTLAGNAGAYTFSMDSFTIDRNGLNFFTDNFNDGLPPPNTPAQAPGGSGATYLMSGTMGPENVGGNGKLVLDQSGSVFGLGLLGNTPVVFQRAILNTNTTSDTVNGLKMNMVFSVNGRFDLVAPTLGTFYGIRLDDIVGGLGNDIIDLRVRNVNGTPIVQFRETDQFGQTQVRFELALDLGHAQIDLELDHPTANTRTIFGRYRYVDGGVAGGFNSFGSTFDIFDGELFTRADINAAHILAVPEPGTLSLLGLGLIGLLARSRRHAQR